MEAFDISNMRRMDRSAAATRQKSCNACVRGKRRCDKTTPSCTRCAAKGLDCIYQKAPAGSSPSSVTFAGPEISQDFDMGGFDLPDLATGSSQGTNTSPESLVLDPNLDFSIVDMLNDGSANSLWNFPGFAEPKASFPAPVPTVPRQVIRDIAIFENKAECMKLECKVTDPLLIHDPRSSIGFIVDYLKKVHIPFSQTRRLPFIHPRLYSSQLPRAVMSAFCAATAYTNRTPETNAWSYRLLQDAAKDILKEGKQAETVIEKIARAQALVIVGTMRVFDGDYTMRHEAEKEMKTLLTWVEDLAKVRAELENGVEPALRGSRDRPPATWDVSSQTCPSPYQINWLTTFQSWIILESCRRTVMMSLSLLCLLSLLKAEMRTSFLPSNFLTATPNNYKADSDLWEENLCFTASSHLWEAKTSVEFYRAWREQPQWCIQDSSFKEFWQYARAEDMDEFTKLMLTS